MEYRSTDRGQRRAAVHRRPAVVRTVSGSRPSVVPDELQWHHTGSDPTQHLLAELRRMASPESVRVQTHPVASDPADAITRVADGAVRGGSPAGPTR